MRRTTLVIALLAIGWAPHASAQSASGSGSSSWWGAPAAQTTQRAATAAKGTTPAQSAAPASAKPKATTALAAAVAPRSFWDTPPPTQARAAATAAATPAKTSAPDAPTPTAPVASASTASRAPRTIRPDQPQARAPQATPAPKRAARPAGVRLVFDDAPLADASVQAHGGSTAAALAPTRDATPAPPTNAPTGNAAPVAAATSTATPAPPAAPAPAAAPPVPPAAPAPAAASAPATPLAVPAAAAAPAPKAPVALPTAAIIRVSDDTSFRFGVLFQGQADWQQMSAGSASQQNLFLRRMRLMFGATIANRFSFFAETDNPNLGKATATSKTISTGLLLQDAFFGYKPVENLDVWAGLIIIPLCRNCSQSAASLLPMDYGPFSFLQSGPTTSAVGRDTGFMARGYALKKHLEVRLGAFQGVRQAGSTNGFRYAGRVQYSFGDPDVVQMFYGGSSFGAKRMVVVGGGFDRQDDYQAWAGDVTVDQPLGPGAVYLQFDALRYDGGTFLKTLPKQTDLLFEGAYYFKKSKLAPYVQVAMQRFSAAALRAGDQTRTQVGLSYFLKGHNANLKAGYLFVDNSAKAPLKGFTVQFQTFFY